MALTYDIPSNTLIYLATPYTRGGFEVRLARFHAVTECAAKLVEQGALIYSPITMTHPIDLVMSDHGETQGSDYWVKFDEAFMQHCSQIFVLMLPGWRDSSGVKREIEYFKKLKGLDPIYLEPANFGVSREIPKFKAAFTL